MTKMNDTIIAKCLSIIIIFGGSLICGLLPAFKVFSKFPRFALSLILSYGGGILIATSLVHILPEARESWPKVDFSAEMTLCLGIFLVYVVEEIAHFLVCHDIHSPLTHAGASGERSGHTHGVHVHHDNPPHRCDEPAAVFLLTDEKTRSDEQRNQKSHSQSVHDVHPHHHHEGGNNINNSGQGETCIIETIVEHGCSGDGSHHHHHNHNNHVKETSLEDQATVKLFPNSTHEPKILPLPGPCHRKPGKLSSIAVRLRSLVGLIALSVHAGLEGLSVGLGSNASDVWYLCGAVAAHKLVIAFCLGMEVRIASSKNECSNVQTSSSASFKFRYVFFFALMTPLGIAIGAVITELFQDPSQKTESTLVAVLQALAAGTLLYVAFFEVILRERARFSGKGLYQLVLVFLGWATMVVVEIALSHGHSHGSSSIASHYDEHHLHDGHDHEHVHDHEH